MARFYTSIGDLERTRAIMNAMVGVKNIRTEEISPHAIESHYACVHSLGRCEAILELYDFSFPEERDDIKLLVEEYESIKKVTEEEVEEFSKLFSICFNKTNSDLRRER